MDIHHILSWFLLIFIREPYPPLSPFPLIRGRGRIIEEGLTPLLDAPHKEGETATRITKAAPLFDAPNIK